MNTYNEEKTQARTRRNAFVITLIVQITLMSGIVYSSLQAEKNTLEVVDIDTEAAAAKAFANLKNRP